MADAQKAPRAMRPTLGLTTVVQDNFGRYRLGVADDSSPDRASRPARSRWRSSPRAGRTSLTTPET
jgi:hypothetical protein